MRLLPDNLLGDLAYGLRNLRNSPAFTATALFTLALGIGANTALFSVIDAVLVRPLPYPNADRLVMLYGRLPSGETEGPSPADFLDYQRQSHSFELLSAVRETPMNLAGRDQPERIQGAVVSAEFFDLMKAPAEIGRAFSAQADKPGAAVAVLSDALWRNRYGGDPHLVGQTINVDGGLRTVVGVMPARFAFPPECQAWVLSRFSVVEQPLSPFEDPSSRRDSHYFDTIGRLKPGVTPGEAQAETDIIARRLKRQFGDQEDAIGSSVVDLREDLVGQTRPTLLLLLGGVALLLFIACANVGNILLARGCSRQREIAIRASLGASRIRIVRQLLTESLLLAVAGACAGLLFIYFAFAPLRAFTPADMLLGIQPALNLRVLAYTLTVSLVSGILFGLAPALHYSKADLSEGLREGSRSTTAGARAQRTQSALVISEVALAAMLMIAAGLLIRSFYRLLAAPEGFNPEHVLSLQLSFSGTRYPTPSSRREFVTEALERIEHIPGITSAAVTSRLPLNRGSSTRNLEIQGRIDSSNQKQAVDYIAVTPAFFQALGIPLLKGRPFIENDTANGAPVVIVNAAAARRFWPNEDALASAVHVGACGEKTNWCRVIGVVGDVRQHNLAQPPVPTAYVPYARDPWPFLTIVAHTQTEPMQLSGEVEAAIHAVGKDQPLYDVRPMRDVISESLSYRRFRTILIGLFAGLALVLGCIGIYGVMNYAVAQRANEIGVRMALGAERGSVLLLIIRSGVRLAFAGVLIGAACSYWTVKLLASSLYGIRPFDAVTFGSAVIVLMAVSILAVYFPARRAASIDPSHALRA